MMDRVVVITGATGALGSAAARAFADRGARLALLSNDREKLDALVRALDLPAARALTLTGDLRDGPATRAAADEVVRAFGRVDILLHLVGGWAGGKSLAEADPADLESMLAQHAWTTFHLAQAFEPHLQANGWSRVIVVSSPQADEPSAGMGAYAAGKAAQQALIRALGRELEAAGGTVHIIQVRAIDVKGAGNGTRVDEIVAAMLSLCAEEPGRTSGAVLPLYAD